MKTLSKNMIIGGLLLGGFTIFGTSLLTGVNGLTKERIIENEKAALLQSLNQVLDASRYNNALNTDVIAIKATELNRDEDTIVYRARKDDQNVAAILTVTAPDGYSGKIKMLVAINIDGTLSGVRVIKHKETPGLGDKIDVSRDPWITQFAGLSLDKPRAKKWKVKKDGGQFDSFSGATITPRAVVKAVARSLQYFTESKESLFKQAVSQP